MPYYWYPLEICPSIDSNLTSEKTYSHNYYYFQEWADKVFEKWFFIDACKSAILLLHKREMYKIWNLCKIAQVSYSVHFTQLYPIIIITTNLGFLYENNSEMDALRIFHSCSCIIEFIKWVGERSWNARLSERFISFLQEFNNSIIQEHKCNRFFLPYDTKITLKSHLLCEKVIYDFVIMYATWLWMSLHNITKYANH